MASISASISGKKILFVITKSNWGGAQTYVYSLATALKERGADVAVILGGTGLPGASTGLLSEKLEAGGIRTIFLKSFARDVSLSSIAREFKAGFELLAVLRKERPDVLHLNSSKAGGIGALAGRLAGTKHIVFTAHGWAHYEPRPAPIRALIWLGSWGTIYLSHKVIVISKPGYRDAPVFFSRRKLILIYNGIASFELRSRDAARAALIEKGIPDKSAIWILMISELIPNKAVDVAIEALALIKDKFPDAILVDFGEGELREKLQRLTTEKGVADRVFLPGFIANGKEYLLAGDIFLMSSHKEGFPMVLLEAGIANVPVIATRTGGIPDLIEDNQTGRLFRPGDTRALAGIFEELLTNTAERARLANALHEHVLADFSLEKMVSATISVYNR